MTATGRRLREVIWELGVRVLVIIYSHPMATKSPESSDGQELSGRVVSAQFPCRARAGTTGRCCGPGTGTTSSRARHGHKAYRAAPG